jgi:uncharacterized protein (TIGR03067 family)
LRDKTHLECDDASMNIVVLIAALLTNADGACPDRRDAEKAALELSDQTKLQGSWVLVAIEINGEKEVPSTLLKNRKVKVSVQKDKYFDPGQVAPNRGKPGFDGGTFALQPDKWPHRITLVWVDNDETAKLFRVRETHSQTLLYELNGDTLRVGGGDGPNGFAWTNGIILTFKREN